MARPKGSTNVEPHEIAAIRRLFREGVLLDEISRQVGRGESVVARAVRGMKRPKPPPASGRHARRNDRVLRMVEKGKSRAEVGRKFGLSPSMVGKIVATHPYLVHLLKVEKIAPAVVARRYRMELSTVMRIATGKTVGEVPRTWGGVR